LCAEPFDPRSHAIAHCEGHGVAHKHDGRDRIATDIVVAVDHVIDGDGDAEGDAEGYEAEGDDEAKPVDVCEYMSVPNSTPGVRELVGTYDERHRHPRESEMQV